MSRTRDLGKMISGNFDVPTASLDNAAAAVNNNINTIGQLGNRNLIINGAMQVAQRQTVSSNVGNKYVLDRFYIYRQNAGSTYTCSQNTVTDLAGFNKSLKMLCSTADTSIASNEEVKIFHKLEGQDLQRFEKGFSTAKGFTLSFYVKTNKTGTYIVELYDRDNGRDVSGSYTVSDTSWNRYTINFPADTTGKFDNDNASSLEIQFWLVAGSAVQGGTLNTSWRAATDPSSATGQINFGDALNNSWEITGIQLEAGDTATPYEHRSYGDELARCQRYCVVLNGAAYQAYGFIGWCESTTRAKSVYNFPVSMRSAPSFNRTGSWMYDGASSNPSFVSINNASSTPYMCRLEDDISGGNTGQGVILLNFNDATATMTFDAEL